MSLEINWLIILTKKIKQKKYICSKGREVKVIGFEDSGSFYVVELIYSGSSEIASNPILFIFIAF